MTYDEILKKVNPIYLSAKGCLGLLAETGDSDFVNFYNSIDKEQLTDFGDDPITRSRIVALEVRHIIWKIIVEETDCQTIVDLPCGYLPHCLTAARLKKNYYGFDLPIVIDEISYVADKFLTENEKSLVHYHGVDATNYFSMRNALSDVKGKICIMTDGLLGYFDGSDLKIFCENIHRLLSEFGGYWYTPDAQFTDLMNVTSAVFAGKSMKELSKITNDGQAQVADSDTRKNLFVEGTLDERRRFMEDSGFSVKSFRYNDKLKIIPSLKDNPELMKKLFSAYEVFEDWALTAKLDASTENRQVDIPFTQEISLNDNVLSIRISGRLDTITAPKLLEKYQEQQSDFTEIHVDAAKLEFISFAGLRVFKFMSDDNLFKIFNANGEVKKILKENGYII